MKNKYITGFILSLAMTSICGTVSFAEDNQAADTKQAVTTEAKADAPATEKNESKTDECCTMGELKPL
ncbi:MAG: hypothetical protein HKK66_02330 [Chlorobiaceae bacterium]|nr:hypothetical protein [Chlorobiaceae bacterium]